MSTREIDRGDLIRQKDRIREARAKVCRFPSPVPAAAKANTSPLTVQTPSAAIVSPTRRPTPDRLAQALSATQPLDERGEAMAAFMERFSADQKARRKKSNTVSNQRKRDRELLAAKARVQGR